MKKVILQIPEDMQKALWRHLVPPASVLEEVAFVYAHIEQNEQSLTFRCIEWTPVLPEGFVTRSDVHLELADETRAAAIKRAHDLQGSLIEFHSHTGSWPAQFSPSDQYGFREFVPHVWWRLKSRPYAAIVVTDAGFDGLAWVTGPHTPQRIDALAIGNKLLFPTGLSYLELDDYE